VFWFLRGLRRGVVTTRYPAKPDAWASTLPSPPLFRVDRITSEVADRLVSSCAAGALRRADGDLVLDIGRCTGCGSCVEVGDGAVLPSGEFELASRDRASLVKRVQIGNGR
jgi:flavoprotein